MKIKSLLVFSSLLVTPPWGLRPSVSQTSKQKWWKWRTKCHFCLLVFSSLVVVAGGGAGKKW